MPKIGFVCAIPPNPNTGMVTVDLSAEMLSSRAGVTVETEHFTYGKREALAAYATGLPFAYRPLPDDFDALAACDLILFWGDFLHARAYWEVDLIPRLVADGTAKDVEAARDLLHRQLMFEGQDASLFGKSILFGNTLISNSAADDKDVRYRDNLSRMLRDAGAVLLRDPLSAGTMAPLRAPQSMLGMDCAFLVRDADLERLADFTMTRAEAREDIAVFFGRTPAMRRMLGYSRHVARRMGLRRRWIPWLPTGRRRSPLVRASGLDPTSLPSPGAVLSALARSRFVITDTYHLAINAWRLGIPTICIGTGASKMEMSLSDKKKETLFALYGASPFYVFAEQIGPFGGGGSAVEQAASALGDPALVEAVSARILAHRGAAEEALFTAMRSILAR